MKVRIEFILTEEEVGNVLGACGLDDAPHNHERGIVREWLRYQGRLAVRSLAAEARKAGDGE